MVPVALARYVLTFALAMLLCAACAAAARDPDSTGFFGGDLSSCFRFCPSAAASPADGASGANAESPLKMDREARLLGAGILEGELRFDRLAA